MSLVRVWSRGRRKILIASAMPAAIIGIPLALLLISQLRSLGTLERASRQMLTQKGIRVAEELAGEIRRDLAATPRDLLDSIPEATVRNRDLTAIRKVLVDGAEPWNRIGILFLGFESAASDAGEGRPFKVLFDRAEADGTRTPSAYWMSTAGRDARSVTGWASAPERRLESYIVARVREIESEGLVEACGSVVLDERHYLLAFRVFRADPSRGEVTHFVGVAARADNLARTYFAHLASAVRDADRAFSTDEPLEVSIVDETGRELYRTGPSLLTRHVHESPFLLDLLGDDHLRGPVGAHAETVTWSVLSGYPGTDAAALARSSTNQQRQLLFLVTLVATVGIVMSGRAIARELGVSELKAEFVSSVSHDLKTPIASIQVLADILQRGAMDSPERASHYGRVIGSETRKLGKLIDGILEFEKIDSGGRMYEGKSIDLRIPVRSAVGEFATQLQEMGFQTELRLPSEPVTFVGDGEALTHAFGNLIGNAIKYSEGERFLRVQMRLRDGNAVIEVHDHGKGVPAAERPKIFERFYRVRGDAGTDPTGTGLGLSIARHVVRCHGGRISVSGRREGGSVFTIEIPLTYTPSMIPRRLEG